MENNSPQPINPTPIPQPSPEPVKPSFPKTLVVSLVILELLTLAVAGYFGYQFMVFKKKLSCNQIVPTPTSNPISPNPTAIGLASPTPATLVGWKVYTNTAYKYTLKYPSDWEIEAKGNADVTTFSAPVLNSPCNYDSGQLCSQIFVETGVYNPENKFEPNFIINLTGSNPDRVSNKVMTTVDGEEAQGFEYFQSNYGDKGRLLYVLVTNHKNTKYTFTYEESQKGSTFQTGKDWQNKNIFDQIVSTFKFTQ